jgi:hypothetical protein
MTKMSTSEAPSPSEVYSGPSEDHFVSGEIFFARLRPGDGCGAGRASSPVLRAVRALFSFERPP